MIKEAYCSYELSKLLREKGFDEECIGYYVEDDPKAIRYSFLQETNSTWEERCCSAPTHQLALAWLREKGIHLTMNVIVNGVNRPVEYCWTGFDENYPMRKFDNRIYPSYEEATEAAIKSVLENQL